jgi:isopenicillin N synthase-like dioxygenase
MSREKIPLVDIAPLIESASKNSKALDQTVRQIDEALHHTGFLYIKNHGVSEDLQKRILALSKNFFAETESFKMQIAMKNSGKAWRGYFPVAGELTSGKPDQKEGIYFGTELDALHPRVRKGLPLHGPNQWPPGPQYAEFKNLVSAYMAQLTLLSQKLMTGVGLGLGLPADYFGARFTDEPTTLFRIFNYPKHTWSDEIDEWGVREHTDMGFLTILLQDNSGGLQVKSLNGEWISAPPIDRTFVVNIGDMLEVWTHGIYRATPHRVRNQGQHDRLSLPFFFDPNWDCTLEPVDCSLLPVERLSSVAAKVHERWDGLDLKRLTGKMTYGDFVWSKVKKVFPDLG